MGRWTKELDSIVNETNVEIGTKKRYNSRLQVRSQVVHSLLSNRKECTVVTSKMSIVCLNLSYNNQPPVVQPKLLLI